MSVQLKFDKSMQQSFKVLTAEGAVLFDGAEMLSNSNYRSFNSKIAENVATVLEAAKAVAPSA